ncbi:hypothetical protein [Paraherbaspirillum soli]|uniref:Uncharacterized protein n=1 Tax=Paraherbaspirillum soli TaxID=631222 RepID=A0ABW0MBS6_9BURK
MEIVPNGKATLSIVLAGHPKLKNDLLRPSMEEIGARSAPFELDGFGADRRIQREGANCRDAQPRVADIILHNTNYAKLLRLLNWSTR